MRIHVSATLAAAVALVAAGAAQAATKTATFNVTAIVSKNCVVSANPLALGTFDGTNDLTAASTIAVRCTSGTPYVVNLSPGSGSYASRSLSSGSGTLAYNLYTDAGYTTIWGDNSPGTGRASGTGAGFAAATNLTVHGRLLASANTGNVDAGTYTDTITATIVY